MLQKEKKKESELWINSNQEERILQFKEEKSNNTNRVKSVI